jgi:hypothetical protein
MRLLLTSSITLSVLALPIAAQAGETVAPKSKPDAPAPSQPVPSERVPGTGLIKPKVDPDPGMQKVPPQTDPDPNNKDVIKPPTDVQPK